jgi:hypothetical protein
MRPVRIIATVVFAAAVAVTGCATQPTSHPTSPTVNPVDRPGPPSVNPPIPDPQLGIWRRFAPAPIPADPAGSYAGVWTGRELLVSAVVFDHRGAIPKGRSVATAGTVALSRNVSGRPSKVEALLHGRAPRKGRTTRPCP